MSKDRAGERSVGVRRVDVVEIGEKSTSEPEESRDTSKSRVRGGGLV